MCVCVCDFDLSRSYSVSQICAQMTLVLLDLYIISIIARSIYNFVFLGLWIFLYNFLTASYMRSVL